MVRRLCNKPLLLVAVALSLLGGGCTNVPTAELKVFREGVVAANTAATPILDELSASERKLKQAVVARQKGAATLVWQDAAYFADVGDAPATTIFRRGHNVLDRFSDVLYGVATGANAKGDIDGVESLAVESAGLLSELSALVPALGGAEVAAKAAFEVARPGLTVIATELSRREAKRVIQVAVENQIVSKLTTALITATPLMFNVLIRDAERATQDIDASDDVIRISRTTYAGRAAKLRIVLSNYVILLQRVDAAWNEAAKAAISGSTVSVAVLTERVTELRVAVVATRRAYADLHAGR
jgi:hypothetical protein